MQSVNRWVKEAVFGDGEHEGHEARYYVALAGCAWCDKCGEWEQAEPVQEVA